VGHCLIPTAVPFGKGVDLTNGVLEGRMKDARMSLDGEEPVVWIDVLRGKFAFVIWWPLQGRAAGLSRGELQMGRERNWILYQASGPNLSFIRSFDPFERCTCNADNGACQWRWVPRALDQ
jgi:hypothetical protein